MNWFSPWLLLGTLAVAIPVVLHFFYRARHRKVPWGAMHFLKLAIEQTSRRLRFQEWILLALRCIVLLLLAFALARPYLSGSGRPGQGDAVDAVFLFDTSYSMGAQLDDKMLGEAGGDGRRKEMQAAKTRLDLAKAAALTVLDNLPDNSTVRVLGCSTEATDYGPILPGNRDQVKQAILDVKLTSQGTDFEPGFAAAAKALEKGSAVNREVYLFSDLSRSGFEQQSDGLKGIVTALHKDATVLLVRCGSESEPPANAAITEIAIPSSVPHEGSRMPFSVIVKNSGTKPVFNATVTLEVEGSPTVESKLVEKIPPGTTAVNLDVLLPGAGVKAVTAKLNSDDIPGDNRYDRIIAVRERLTVLIIDGGPARSSGELGPSDAIRLGAVPVQPSEVEAYYVKAPVFSPDEAAPGLLASADLVVLANVPATNADVPGEPGLSDEFVTALAEYVRKGGSLLITSGSHVMPKGYNAVFGRQGANLLPYELEEVLMRDKDREFRLEPDSIEGASYLSSLRDGKARAECMEVKLRKLISLGAGDDAARVLFKTTDNKPVVAMKPFGLGEVIFVTTGLDNRWGDWAILGETGTLPMFVQLTLSHLTNRMARGTNSVAGMPLRWSPPKNDEKGFEAVKPDKSRQYLGKASGGGKERLGVELKDTPDAGLYRFENVTEPNEKGERRPSDLMSPPFAVNPDLKESDQPLMATKEEMEAVLGFSPVILDATADLAAERSRREWTIPLLLLLFAAAAGEAFWAWRCGRAW